MMSEATAAVYRFRLPEAESVGLHQSYSTHHDLEPLEGIVQGWVSKNLHPCRYSSTQAGPLGRSDMLNELRSYLLAASRHHAPSDWPSLGPSCFL